MEEQLILPSIFAPDNRQKRLVLIVALLVPVPFIAIIPIGQIQLPRVDSYIPVVDTVMLVNDSIAATLLLVQFSIIRSPSLLALAGGFLLTAFLVVPHALTFPGAFAPNGMLGAGLQTTPWLNEFWFLGLPSAVIAYALLKGAKPIPHSAVRRAIFTTVTAAFAATYALLWLTTSGIKFLPAIMSDTVHPRLAWHFLPLVGLSIIAMALLWSRRRSSLDLWLLVVLEAWMLNAFLFNKLVIRFSLFWYFGRVFSALATSVVLLFLLSETTMVYWRLARSHMMLRRERDNKLLNFETIAAAISHEIKQPLTAIVANGNAALALLDRSPPDVHEAREALSDIVGDGHRASETLDGIRALFQTADQGRQPIDMNRIALEVLQSLRSELNEHGVTARPELTSELPLIEGNRNQLQQVIFNLVHNAVEAMDATPNRSRMLRLTTERRDRNAIAVTVQDSGPGIDPKQIGSIFDAFVTTKAHGMGLGLAICRVIIERHGGQLSASSDGRSGALFQLVLPIKSEDWNAARAEQAV
jgi:signal transduction histidine kinase